MDAAGAAAWLADFAAVIARESAHLTDLDAAIGDADHGANMDRGMRAVAGLGFHALPVAADEAAVLT